MAKYKLFLLLLSLLLFGCSDQRSRTQEAKIPTETPFYKNQQEMLNQAKAVTEAAETRQSSQQIQIESLDKAGD